MGDDHRHEELVDSSRGVEISLAFSCGPRAHHTATCPQVPHSSLIPTAALLKSTSAAKALRHRHETIMNEIP
jgi:hypothetical protein